MNLQDTVEALEAKNITVAINLGVHSACTIDSNCPLAVELRRIIKDAGITLAELLEGYQLVTARDPVSYNVPEVNGKISLTIAGKQIDLDIKDIVGSELKTSLMKKSDELAYAMSHTRTVGVGLYSSYLSEIRRHRNTRVLPQLRFTVPELIKSGCTFTADGNHYIFLYPGVYNPKTLVNGDIRSKLATRDITRIKNNIIIKIRVSDNKFFPPVVLDERGGKFRHYHGNAEDDCWGHVNLPARWDGTLRGINSVAHLLYGSLATINLDSILNHHPISMPLDRELFERSTVLGREGEFDTVIVVQPDTEPPVGNLDGLGEDNEDTEHRDEETILRRWGGRGR